MHRKRASRSRFMKDVVRRVGTDKIQGQFQVHPCQVACAPHHRADVVLEFSSSDDYEVSLNRNESCADLPEVSLQLLDPSE